MSKLNHRSPRERVRGGRAKSPRQEAGVICFWPTSQASTLRVTPEMSPPEPISPSINTREFDEVNLPEH